MTWLIAGPILGAALLLAWAWWRLRVKSRAIRLDALRWQSDAWIETLREHQLSFTAMDPKYVGRELIVQVDDRALAEQRRLDEMEL